MAGFAFVKKNPGLSTLIALELVLFLIISYQVEIEPKISLLDKMGLAIFGPVQDLNDSIAGKINSNMEARKSAAELREENNALKEKTKDLESLQVNLAETSAENERLRDLLDLKRIPEWEYVYAEVVGRSRSRGDSILTINKGTNQGIRSDQGVFCLQGVVGIVWEASPGYAKVITMNNPGTVVAAIIQPSRYQESYYIGKGNGFGTLDNFPNFESIRPEDLVLTSGLDQIFPKGLRIGKVSEAKPTPRTFQEVKVELTTAFSRLEEVIVLVPKREEEAARDLE